MKNYFQNADTLGAFASTLCVVHCLATPFIFVAQACASSCCSAETTPTWWLSMDYIFLVVSFFAVYRSSQSTTTNFMKPALWLSWGALFVTLANEQLGWFSFPDNTKQGAALLLTMVHLYNLFFCQCKKDSCGVS